MALPFISSASEAAALLERLDGVVLSGSEDLDPALWDEALHPRAELMHPQRQQTEMFFCRELLARPLPLLGICGGMQNLAIAAGGSLHQHLPDLGPQMLDHSLGFEGPGHPVAVEADSLLGELLGATATTNSAHHQGVSTLGDNMTVTARSPDGVIEAYELRDRPFALCVQWHPERMVGDKGQRNLFTKLVESCTT